MQSIAARKFDMTQLAAGQQPGMRVFVADEIREHRRILRQLALYLRERFGKRCLPGRDATLTDAHGIELRTRLLDGVAQCERALLGILALDAAFEEQLLRGEAGAQLLFLWIGRSN